MAKRRDRLGRFRIGKVAKNHVPRETTYTCFAPSESTIFQHMESPKNSIPHPLRSDGSFLNPEHRSLEKIRNQENFPSLLDGDSTAHTSESENLPFERIYHMWSEKEKADSPMLNGRKVTDHSITSPRVSNMQKRSPSPKIMSFLTQDRKFDQSMAQNDSRNKIKHDRQDTVKGSGKKGKGTVPLIPSFLKAFPRPSKIMNDDPELLLDDQSFDDEMKSILFQKDSNDTGNLYENEDSFTADESIEGGVRENLELAMDGSVVRGQGARHNNHYQYSYRDISHEGGKLHSQSSFDEIGHKAADPYLNVDAMTTVGSEVTVKTRNTSNPNDPFQSLDNASTSGSEISTRTGNTTRSKSHKVGTRGINNYPFGKFQDVEEDIGKGNDMDDEIPDSAFEADPLKHESDFSHSMKVSASFDGSFEINSQHNFQESNHFVFGLDGSQTQSNALSSNRLLSRRQNNSFSHSLHNTSQSTEGKSQKPNFSNSAGSDVFDGLSDFAFSSASSNGIDYFANKSSYFSPSKLSNASKNSLKRSEDGPNHLDALQQKLSGGMQLGSSGHTQDVDHSQPKSRFFQPVNAHKDLDNVSARILSTDRIGDSPFSSKQFKLPPETSENQCGDNENIEEVNKSMHFQIGKESKHRLPQHAQNAVMDNKSKSNNFLSSSALNEDDRHRSPGSAPKPPFSPSKSKGVVSLSEETPHDKIKIQGGTSFKSKRNVSNELSEKSKIVNGTEHEKFEKEYIHKPQNNLVTRFGGFLEQTNDQEGIDGSNVDAFSSSIGASPHVKINATSQKKSEREDLLKHLQFLVSPSASGAYVDKGSRDGINDENKITQHSAQINDKNQFKDEKVKNLDGVVVEETDIILNVRQERNDSEDSLSNIRWIPSMLRLYKQRIENTKANSFDANTSQNPPGKVHLQEENVYRYHTKGTSESPRSVFDHFETDTDKPKLEPTRLYNRSIQSADSSRIPIPILITDCELPASQFLALFINDTFGSEIREPHQLVSGITEDGELALKQKGRLVSYLDSTKNGKQQRSSKTDECHKNFLDKAIEIHNKSLFYLENDRVDDAMENYEVFLDQCGEGMFQGGDVEITKAVIGTLLHNLGLLHILIGEFDMSVEFLNEATNVRRDANPEVGLYNRDVATSLNTMGMAYFASGCYGEALKVFADVLHILQEITNSDHIHISHVLNNVGITYFTMQEIDSSLEAFEEALEIHRSFLIEIFGRKTNLDQEIDQEIIKNTLLGIAYTLCNMAYIYSYIDSPKEAKFLLEEALITEKTILADNEMGTGKIQKFLSNYSLQ